AALDALRRVTRGSVLIETAVCDAEVGRRLARRPLTRFYPAAELDGDPTNWFAPTIAGLLAWCGSSGLEPSLLAQWPPGPLARRLFRVESERWWSAARRARGTARRCIVQAVRA